MPRPPIRIPPVLRGHLWPWYPLVAGALTLLYVAGPLNAGPVFNALGASSAVAVMLGLRRWRPQGRLGWELLALGLALFVAGDVLAYNYQPLFGHPLPFPSIADPLYLAMYPCVAGGLWWLVRLSDPTGDRATVIDALVITIGIGTLVWVFLMAPYVHDAGLSFGAKATSVAYPAMDLLVAAMGARLILGSTRRCASAVLLVAALAALLGTDAVYGWLQLHGGYETGGLLDAGWIAFYVLVGTAALHPSMRRLTERQPPRRARLTPARLLVFGLTSLLAPSVQLARSLLALPREPVISVAAGLLFVLVLARLAGMVRVHEAQTESTLRRRYEQRLAALVQHASDVVTLLDSEGRITYVSPSVERLVGYQPDALLGRRWAELLQGEETVAMERLLGALAAGESAGADHRLRHRDGSWPEVETLATNLLGDGTVEAIVLNIRDVTQRKALERRLAHEATHDALTGLPGRALIEDRIRQALARTRRGGRQIAVLFVDLDDFKAVNDTLGHAAGDAMLQEVARRLAGAVREVDSAARLSGDEFVLLLDGIGGADEATAVAHRCLAALAEPVAIGDRQATVSASIGIALGAADGDTADELIHRADTAMYRAKHRGKRGYELLAPAAA